VLNIDMEPQQVLSSDQQRLQVDAYARYRIIDPVKMVRTAGTWRHVDSSAARDPQLGRAAGARPAQLRLAADRRARHDDGQHPQAARRAGAQLWRAR
jgi:membrane protease subunit HflC